MFGTNLVPLTAKQAENLKDEMYRPLIFGGHENERHTGTKGIRAIQLRYQGKDTRVERIGPDTIISTNGKTWIYWKLDREEMLQANRRGKKKMLESAAAVAFTDPQAFPLERIAKLAGVAFSELHPLQVHLWTTNGRTDWGAESLNAFVKRLNENWLPGQGSALGTEPEKWLNGLAILISDREPMKLEEMKPAPVPEPVKRSILKKAREKKRKTHRHEMG